MSVSLSWKPSLVSRAEPLRSSGALSPAPFATRNQAFAAVTAWRQKNPGAGSAFLVTPAEHGGWVATRFSGKGRGSVDASELTLNGSAELHPLAFVIDGRGRVAQPRAGEVWLRIVEQSVLEAPVAEVGNRVLPRVPAEPQTNHGRNVSWSPTLAFRPGRDIEQLVDVMKWVEKTQPKGTVIKAGGSRHAWSKAAVSDAVYIHPEGMRFVELAGSAPLESLRADLPAAQRHHLVRVGSGTTVRELNAELWSKGLALPVLGGFDGQTLGGVLPTGTHGSALSQGPMSELVRSIDLVKPNGEKVRLEPAGGPTDGADFARTHPGWTLVQDDATFDAARVNLGTFGVVHSYLLETRDRFYLNEVRTKTTGREAEAVLRGGNVYNLLENETRPPQPTERTFAGHPTPAFHLELWWNPHSDSVLVTSRHPVELEGPEPSTFGRPTRDLFRTLMADPGFSRPALGTVLSENLGPVIARANEVVKGVAPALAPKLLDNALGSLVDGEYTQRSYNVFNIGDGANLLPAQSATLSVPLRGDLYLRAMEILRRTAAEFSKEHGQWQTGPISLRFVKGSGAALGDPEDVAKFELIFSGNGDDDQALAKSLTGKYYAALHAELGDDVRFHWGQLPPDSAQTTERLRAAYPRFDAFNAVRRRFDPEGKMLNAWQRKMFEG